MDHVRSGRTSFADCLRERGEFIACSGDEPPARDGRPGCAGSGTWKARAATADGEPGAFACERGFRRGDCIWRSSGAEGVAATVGATAQPSRSGVGADDICTGNLPRRWSSVWTCSRAAVVGRGRGRNAEIERSAWREHHKTIALAEEHFGGRRNRAVARPPDRSGTTAPDTCAFASNRNWRAASERADGGSEASREQIQNVRPAT